MSQSNRKVHAALAIGGLALALSIHTAVRARTTVKAAGATSNACIDQDARDQAAKLRRALAERDVLVARLARTMSTPAGGSLSEETPPDPGRAPDPETSPDPEPRRYARFEIPNPAVTMTQKDDGTYDIRTTNPSLAGSEIQIIAVTQSGDEDRMLVRIPE